MNYDLVGRFLNGWGGGLPPPFTIRKPGGGADSPCQGEMSRSDKGGRDQAPALRKGCGRGVGALHEAPAQNFRFAGGRIVMRPYNGGHDKSWLYTQSVLRRGTTCRARRFTLRRLRDARLPFVSGHKQPGYARLGLYPSLRSIRAAPHASALLFTLRRLRDARLPFVSGHKQPGYARLGLYPSLRSIRAAPHASALLFTLRRLRDARLPFVSGHKQPGYARLGLYPSLRSIRAAPHASALLFTLRHARGRVAKSCDYADKHPGLRPSLVCRHPLRP